MSASHKPPIGSTIRFDDDEIHGFPSQIKQPLVEICRLEGHPLFVCGLQGNPCMLEQLESELDEYTIFNKGDGSYLCRAEWIEAQIGYEGRVEIPAYWDLDLIAFKSIT